MFCGYEIFGNEERIILRNKSDLDLGCSVISTLYGKRRLGSATSMLSMRRNVLEKILPIPYLEDWRTRADDCLAYGASIAGARKFYMAKSLVRYRVHDKNYYYGRKYGNVDSKRITKLFSFLSTRMNHDNNLYNQAHVEFRTISRPHYDELKLYINIIRRDGIPYLRKIGMVLSMIAHFLAKGDLFSDSPLKSGR